MASVSAVISTFERPDSCERALRSVLAQEPAPLEVLVCDDGSRDETPQRLREWERRDARVRYVRVEPNHGAPAVPRNAGVTRARGDWVAFLDDDDEWLPGKLAKQLGFVAVADVIAMNAVTTSGVTYFPDAPTQWHPSRADVIRDNPVILSSALVRRESLLRVGGFPTRSWQRAIEDYGAWLRMADAKARFLILGDSGVRYATHDTGRFSTERARVAWAVARLAITRAAAHPLDRDLRRAAADRTAVALAMLRQRLQRPA